MKAKLLALGICRKYKIVLPRLDFDVKDGDKMMQALGVLDTVIGKLLPQYAKQMSEMQVRVSAAGFTERDMGDHIDIAMGQNAEEMEKAMLQSINKARATNTPASTLAAPSAASTSAPTTAPSSDLSPREREVRDAAREQCKNKGTTYLLAHGYKQDGLGTDGFKPSNVNSSDPQVFFSVDRWIVRWSSNENYKPAEEQLKVPMTAARKELISHLAQLNADAAKKSA